MNSLVRLVRFIFSNIRKILLVLILCWVFLFLLFPFGDLSDVVTNQVAKGSGNRVYLQFDNLHLNPVTLSVTLDRVQLETEQISNLGIEELMTRASFPTLMFFAKQGLKNITGGGTSSEGEGGESKGGDKPPEAPDKNFFGGSIAARGIFKGEVDLSLSPGTAASGKPHSQIELSASSISLKDLRETMNLGLPINGQLSLNSQGTADFNFAEQPDLDMTLVINKFELPSTSVNLGMMGAITLPTLNFEKVELKGKLSNGKFQIESGKLGSSKDNFYGEIKGDLALTLVNAGNTVLPQFGPYDLSINISANRAFQSQAGFFLNMLDGFKVPGSGDVSTYKLRAKGSPFDPAPQLSPIR